MRFLIMLAVLLMAACGNGTPPAPTLAPDAPEAPTRTGDPVADAATSVHMSFFDASGTAYTTTDYRSEMAKRLPGVHPTALLIVTRDDQNPEFRKQIAILDALDAEALQVVFVVGNASVSDRQGYWLEPENADALLEGGHSFRFIAVGDDGEVCFSSDTAVERTRITTSNNALTLAFSRCAPAQD